ncbi:hypothetical protein WCX49_07245 [Sulfurimonas sp. HSL-1656]|uniref:hypothetical protein n=1 Tax=Thiomicrolovo subterrani TaxID=3131934 RepID=UPI0031F7AAD5
MERVRIGENHKTKTVWKTIPGTVLIYLPILVAIPFAALAVVLVRWHLRIMGAENLKSYRDFVPEWASHRYTRRDQIIFTTDTAWWQLARYRLFWLFNCKVYCPLSVALFSYLAYLVKVVENWWCPFGHDKKPFYKDAAIDSSFWHIYPEERAKLHPDDRENPIWNETSQERQ